MARVTVEDCITKIPNRFELVAIASQRARDISSGSPLTVERDNDKNPVVALREIADGTVSLGELKEALINGLQTKVETEDINEDEVDYLGLDQNLNPDQENGTEIETDQKVLVATIESIAETENPEIKET